MKKKKHINPVVSQHYEEDIHKAFVIRGNSAILKCDIPSFVADFVSVISWHTDQEENFFPGTEYGVLNVICTLNVFVFITLVYQFNNDNSI